MTHGNIGTIGSRLKAQREKLGLSQADMAEKAGVTARSQRNYESGTRVPDAEYLIAVSKIGVNLLEVLHGDFGTHKEGDDVAYVMAIEQAFGIKHEDLAAAVDIALIDDNLISFDPDLLFREMCKRSPIIQTLIERGRRIDTALLADILNRVDVVSSSQNLVIEPNKKAQVVAMLYRAFHTSGNADQAMVEEAVKLASA